MTVEPHPLYEGIAHKLPVITSMTAAAEGSTMANRA
jgi:hypothetical protein